MEEQANKLERVTRKWWFFAILIVAQFMVMPFSSRNFDFTKIGSIISTTLSNSFVVEMHDYYLCFQLFAIITLVLLFVLKNKFSKLFNIYVFLSYIAFAILQNVAVTENYGLSVVTINILMFLFVAYAWLKEVLKPENDYTFSNLNWKESWLIPLAFIAFWAPLSYGVFDFKPMHLLYSGSSLAFCLMTPVFLTIMTFNIPKINIITYRITAIIGVIIGFYNMMNFQNPKMINVAILHFPLLFISIYALIKSYKIKNK
ncbi:MAG: hypothetical protein IMY72_07770 [Bacteroidetes bacterium]|nr:hypothetical protein [Bacteroidota bacterium]